MGHMWIRAGVVCLCMISLLFGCGGGGGSGGETATTDSGTGTNTDPDSPPLVSGFDFVLEEGDFWEYDWDFNRTYAAVGSNINRTYRSTFRVTLGTSIDIGGTTFYGMLLSGNAKAESYNDFAPRWSYLAVSGNKILASQDGATITTIFDAQTGKCPGSGYFTIFPATTLMEATLGTINNDYLNEAAYQVKESSSSSNCEYYPGIGTICGGDYDETLIEREYYMPDVGPVGLFQYSAISDSSWSATRTSNVGLVLSSFWGDIAVTDLEIEPNNQLSNAMPIALGEIIEGGSVSEEEYGGVFTVSAGTAINEVEPNDLSIGAQLVPVPSSISGDVLVGDNYSLMQVSPPGPPPYQASFEDWYQFNLSSSQNLDFLLDFQGTGADLDLFLFNSSLEMQGSSIYDNLLTDQFTEEFSVSLAAGDYYLAVDAYNTDLGRADYSLDVSTGNSTIDIVDLFTFTIDVASTVEVEVEVAGGPTMVILDSSGGTIVSGASINENLNAGTYFIGLSAGGPYTLTTSGGGTDGRPGAGGGGPGG